MLDFKYLREHIDDIKEKIAHRGATIDWETFFELDASRRELLQEVEDLRCQRNTASEKIALLKRMVACCPVVTFTWVLFIVKSPKEINVFLYLLVR